MSDGRYFPSEAESEILSKYIVAYFNNPERSAQRAQVVQMVVQILSTYNKHWNQRTVRLWFNNNKKLLNPQVSQVFIQHQDIPQEFQYQIKNSFTPPRPASAMAFSPIYEKNAVYQRNDFFQQKQRFPSNVVVPNKVEVVRPKPDSIANSIMQERMKLNENQTPEQQKESEQSIVDAIINANKLNWDEFVLPQSGNKSIVSEQSLTNAEDPTIAEPIEVIPFDSIETSLMVEGLPPAIVTFTENEQRLLVGSNSAVLDLPTLASSMTFDNEFGAFWINAGNQINAYKAETLELIKSVSTGNHISPTTTMTFFNHSLFFGCGSSVLVYSSFDEEQQQINFTETDDSDSSLGITSSFNMVTSISPLDNGLVVASVEHHTPYLISFEGVQIARFTGHSAGVTCLSELSPDTFVSGSADQTARIWDKRDLSSVALLKHNGIITSVCSLGQIVFTGGTDGVIRQWDLRMNTPRFVGKCEGTPQTMHFSMETGILSVAVSQKKKEEFYDLGKFPPPMMLDGNVSNAIVNFQP